MSNNNNFRYIFIIKDGEVVNMNPDEIFDTNKYDKFEGVTYTTSAKFINENISKFHHTTLVTGAGNNVVNKAIYKSFSGVTKNIIENLRENLSHNSINLYQELSDYVKQLMLAKDLQLLTPLKMKIHDKFYLLSNSKTGDNRIIIGSANLSHQAFDPHMRQLENVMIFDNNTAFKAYYDYFQKTVLPNTKRYFLPPFDEMTKEKLKNKPKEEKAKDVSAYTVMTPAELAKLDSKLFRASIDELEYEGKKDTTFVVPEIISELKHDLDDKVRTANEEFKNDVRNNKITLELLRDSISQTSKTPKFKSNKSLDNTFKKYIHIKQAEDVGRESARRNTELISQPGLRTKDSSGLLIAKDNEKLFPFGYQAKLEAIRKDLDNIDALMNSYKKFAVDADDKYCSRIMEAILYTFESPFLYEIRQKAQPEIEGQDIPQFLFIGGQASSGKSSLLKILMKLLGIYSSDTPQLYDQIVPEGEHNAKSKTIKLLKAWIDTENVTPIIIDEVPEYFFTSLQYGNDLVVNETNYTDTSNRAFPTFIASTNSSNYSFSDRARRRSYYLANDRIFDEQYRQQAGIAYNHVLSSLTSNLFNDFCIRFSNLLITKDDSFWHDYGTSNGLYDFLRPARIIFKNYYKELGLPIPSYFPETRSNDEQESGRDKWRKLYEAHEEWFRTNPQNKSNMFISINILNEHIQLGFGNHMTPADEYRNDLNPKVVVGNKNSMQIEINKKRFFAWIGINPKHKWFRFK